MGFTGVCFRAERQVQLAAAAAQTAEAEEKAQTAEESRNAKRAAEEEVASFCFYNHVACWW